MTKEEVLIKINEPTIDMNVLESILDLKQTTIITKIEPTIAPEYNTDYSNSIFYHKVPKYTEFIKQKSLVGYNLDFLNFISTTGMKF